MTHNRGLPLRNDTSHSFRLVKALDVIDLRNGLGIRLRANSRLGTIIKLTLQADFKLSIKGESESAESIPTLLNYDTIHTTRRGQNTTYFCVLVQHAGMH